MVEFLNTVDSVLYYPILIVVLAVAGIYFSIRTRFVQVRLFVEAIRTLVEKPQEEGGVSSLDALFVSTASRVGTGNIIGVSTAICLGGPGAAFWMWVLAIIGASSAFVESTLAQIYKRRDHHTGECYGGPAYYIESALHSRWLGVVFAAFLILTYAFGFNLLCSYNMQSTFETYSFYNPSVTPWIIGVILAVLVGFCLFGGGKRIVKTTSVLVPFMGLFYVFLVYLIVVINYDKIPSVIVAIMRDAFDFEAIGGGIAGSCLMYGIKRGLYSNEAGVGSAPNAAAAAHVSHPVKQGLAQVISVYIDTLFLCTATAMMCLVSGVPGTAENAGAMYVQLAVSKTFDAAGPVFITVAMALFAFTTLLGNLFYVHNAIAFINNKKMPGKKVMTVIHIACCLVVLFGAVTPMDACWALADITMGGMALINLPACVILGNVAFMALRDYERQRKQGRNPAFIARYIKLDPSKLDYWKHKERDSKASPF